MGGERGRRIGKGGHVHAGEAATVMPRLTPHPALPRKGGGFSYVPYLVIQTIRTS